MPDASVEFGPGLTVIYGGSNTGKSYVFEAIDFMLGAKSLKSIPESEAYKDVMLTMTLADDTPLTLVRRLAGGHFSAFLEDLRTLPSRPADFTLTATHGNTSGGRLSLSRYLLQAIGLDGKELRKNRQNVTAPLSFRNLCLLSVIDETKVQSKIAPQFSGQFLNRTPELSLLKLLLQGEDDSKFARSADAAEKRKVSKGKTEILERAIGELQNSIDGTGSVLELKQRHGLILNSIQQQTSSIESSLNTRVELLTEQMTILGEKNTYQARLDEVAELLGRFGLLKAKYESDLARLEMVQEAGTLLGYFQPGVCVFCGAEVEHQSAELHAVGEVTAFGESVLSEMQKTAGLRDDLNVTIGDLESQEIRLRQAISEFMDEADRLRAQIGSVDVSLQPEREELQELLAVKSAIELALNTHDQIARLLTLKATVEPEDEGEPVRPPELNELIAAEFSASINRVVEAWSLPNAGAVRYSKSASDVMVDEQPRSSHGKGMRAVLHAAFTAGLAQYCFDRELEHPGFIVMDTPVRPYREPDPGLAEAPSEEEVTSLTERFYSYFDTQFDGQSIILENEDPPETLSSESVLVYFSGNRNSGRYGFFPPRPGLVSS
ncbi:hypothetical protein [Micromonospora sp. NPDC005189]|uniref:hypothetical protein n=1 Tax=unclassified Micromonospora TaxID=2617518 RepID=UPI0033B0B3E9